MRAALVLLLLTSLAFISCEKEKSTCYGKDPFAMNWLQQKKQEFSNCTCLAQIRECEYKGQTVFECRIIDPLCLGINTVYRCDGSLLLSSADYMAYEDFMNKATSSRLIWQCDEPVLPH